MALLQDHGRKRYGNFSKLFPLVRASNVHIDQVSEFIAALERDGISTGVKLFRGSDPLPSNDRSENLLKCFEKIKAGGARIVVVLLCTESYGKVKLVSDKMGMQDK